MAYGTIMGQSPDITPIEQKIDNIEKNYVPKSGTTMTGALNMGNNKISGVANGVNKDDVATVGQLSSAGSYPFKGSGLKFIGHYTGYLGYSETKQFALNAEYNSIFVYCMFIGNSIVDDRMTSDSVISFGTVLKPEKSQNIPTVNYAIGNTSTSAVTSLGSIKFSYDKRTVWFSIKNCSGYYDFYVFTP